MSGVFALYGVKDYRQVGTSDLQAQYNALKETIRFGPPELDETDMKNCAAMHEELERRYRQAP